MADGLFCAAHVLSGDSQANMRAHIKYAGLI